MRDLNIKINQNEENSTNLYGLAAEFSTTGDLLEAAKKVHSKGYKWWDCLTPFPVHGLDDAMGIGRTILPLLVFGGGLTGFIVACCLQIFTNATGFDFWLLVPIRGYEFIVSGKPLLSGPAFVPVAFELTVLLASLTAVGGTLLLNGLPWLSHPTLRCEQLSRATDDKFYIVLESRDPKFEQEEARILLESLNPDRIIEVAKE